MTVTPRVLNGGTLLTTSIATYWTSTNIKSRIDKCTLANITAGAITCDVHRVPSGGTADTSNKLIDGRSLAAHETYLCPEIVGRVLEAGDTLQAKASAISSVNIMAEGVTIS